VQDVPRVVAAVKSKFPNTEMRKAKKPVENGRMYFGTAITSKVDLPTAVDAVDRYDPWPWIGKTFRLIHGNTFI
jgi:hypothetical protein